MALRLSPWCNRLIEAGWLLAVVLVPLFFNIRTSRVFEPDKALWLRTIMLVVSAVWLVKAIEYALHWLGARLKLLDGLSVDRPHAPKLFYWLIASAMLFAVVNVASTFTSIHFDISLLGSYQRGQGAEFTCWLVVLALLIATHLRTRAQVGRLLAALALGSVPSAVYGLLQHFRLDPLSWGGDTVTRIASTSGNAIFLGGYLVMVIPVTVAALIALAFLLWRTMQPADETTTTALRVWRVIGYGSLGVLSLGALSLQLWALLFTFSWGPWWALLFTAVPFALLLLAVLFRNVRVRQFIIGIAALIILGIVLVSIISALGNTSLTAQLVQAEQIITPTARQLMAEGARELIYTRPLAGGQLDRWVALRPWLGYGPETMYLSYNQVYQPELAHYEARNASPDRAHNQLLDIGVNLGWLGLSSFLFLWAIFFIAGLRIILTTPYATEAIVASGALGAGLAHWIETQWGIPTIASQLLFWVAFGLIAALSAQRISQTASTEVEPQLPTQGLASGVALLLLSTVAIAAIGIAFIRANEEGYSIGALVLMGFALSVMAWVVNVVAMWHNPAELSGVGRALYTGAMGTLSALALVVCITLVVVVSSLAALLTRVTSSLGFDFVLAQAQTLPLWTWSIVLLGLFSIGLALPHVYTPKPQCNWRTVAVFVITSIVGFFIVLGAVTLIFNRYVPLAQADALFKIALNYDMVRDWDRSIRAYGQTVAFAPREDFYYLYLGRAYLEKAKVTTNSTQRAELLEVSHDALTRARELNPLNTDHTTNLARFYRTWGELTTEPAKRGELLNRSLEFYEQSLVLSPHNAQLYNEAATVFMLLGSTNKALEKLQQSLKLDDQFAQTYLLRGDIYLNRNPPELETAAQAYQQALKYDPSVTQAHSALGLIYSRLNRIDEAIAENLIVANQSQSDVASLRNLALLYQQKGDLVQSLNYARRALAATTNDNDKQALQSYITVWQDISDNLNALNRNPNDYATLRNLIRLYQQAGKPADALTYAQRALPVAPSADRTALQQFITQLEAQIRQAK